MAFQPGQSGNPGGVPVHAREAINKMRRAIARAIDMMRDSDGKKVIGVVRLAENIRDALEANTVQTMKDLSAYMPKDVLIESTSNKDADRMTDDELAAIIAQRAIDRARQLEPGEPESIDDMLS